MSKDNSGVENEIKNVKELLTPKQYRCWVLHLKGRSQREIADEVGIDKKTVFQHLKGARKKLDVDDSVPMSEDTTRFRPDFGAQDCIDELIRVASLRPDRVITRNFFRVNSRISESTWNQFFGTFEEFKRQADIKLSRSQHRLEREIAKHASQDHYRDMSDARLDWAETYIRKDRGRWKTAVVCSDLHDIDIDRFYLRVLIDTIKRVDPDLVALVGDVFDLPEFGKYTVDPRDWNPVQRIEFVHDRIMRPIREVAPDAQMDLIEGNHEARLLRHLADSTPALRAVLSDLHGMSVSDLLGLQEFEINYVAKGTLASFRKADETKELSKNYQIYWDSFLCHHFPQGRNFGLPGVNGHHHHHRVFSEFNPLYGAFEWHQLGCGHVRDASFAEGEKWNNGFAVVNIDTKTKSVVFDYIFVGEHHAVSGGKWYYRKKGEEIKR